MRDYILFAAVTAFIVSGSMLYMTDTSENPSEIENNLQRFDSEQEFRSFISNNGNSRQDLVGNTAELLERNAGGAGGPGEASVDRSSTTNIQVSGVDEPDILKNSGEKIFYSPERSYFYGDSANTSVFSTVPAENFSEIDEIPVNGRMFLTNSSVISIGENISSFDRETHELQWRENLNSSIEASRKINDSIYFVLRKSASSSCPVRPMESRIMPCTSFYYPGSGSADTTYSLIEMDADSGEVLNSNGFVGERSNSITYISEDAIYLTYSEEASQTDLMMEFLESEGDEYLDSETMERIEELQSYDISEASLRSEVGRAIEEYFSGLEDSSEARKEFEEAMDEYVSDRKRELSTTSIAKFDLDLELEAEGEVPGTVNDRFSLDASNEGLRVATTVGETWQFNVETENDLYTLDKDLEKVGSVKGMGVNERIYSARFIDDKAYIVTFRRIDPFHVIDLSDHENPELKGELKLPGFSSYLHPLQEDRVLGIGEENNSVKAVIFDVEDDEPSIVDSKVLDDYYSDISSNHHTFQIDRENKVFFLPGSEGGHFFSYENGLEEVKYVNMTDARRSAFVNQNFYVFGDTEASVIDIESWETVKNIQFRNATEPKPVPLPGPMPRPVE